MTQLKIVVGAIS